MRKLIYVRSLKKCSKVLVLQKYYGDVLLQKTYIADFFTRKQVPNRGQCELHLLEDHHEAIIPRKSV
jgi:hypothetical protein